MYTPWQNFQQFVGLQGFELIGERQYKLNDNVPQRYWPSVLLAGHREKFLLLHARSVMNEATRVFYGGKVIGCLDMGQNPSNEALEALWRLHSIWDRSTHNGTHFFSLNLSFDNAFETLAIIEQHATLVPWVGLSKCIDIGGFGEEDSRFERWWSFKQTAPSWVRAFIQ